MAPPAAVPPAPLRIDGLTAGYRGTPVLHGVTFDVGPGQVVGLVGPNGAGKSTLLDVVCGTLRPTAGRVYLFGRDVTRLPAHRRARLGLGRTFQRLEPFGSLSIADNLLVAAEASSADGQSRTPITLSHSDGQPKTSTSPTTLSHSDGQPTPSTSPTTLSRSDGQPKTSTSPTTLSHSDGQPQSPITLSRSDGQPTASNSPITLSRSSGQSEATVHSLLRRFGLVDFAGQPPSVVPTGVARIVEIARALAAGARVLLLDEPSSGMSGQQVSEFAETVRALRDEGLSILLVEHDAALVDTVCDRVYELGLGAGTGTGTGMGADPDLGPGSGSDLSRAGGWRPAPSTSG